MGRLILHGYTLLCLTGKCIDKHNSKKQFTVKFRQVLNGHNRVSKLSFSTNTGVYCKVKFILKLHMQIFNFLIWCRKTMSLYS